MAFSKRDWEKLIRGIAVNESRINFSKHALKQIKARNISNLSVVDVLRKGNILMEPEPDIKTGHTVCRMERFTTGKPITVAVAVEDSRAIDCIVVTAFVTED